MALQEEFEKQGTLLFRYRSFIPAILLAVGIVIWLRSELHPGDLWIKAAPYDGYYLLFCMLVTFFGFAIRIYTVGHTPVNTSGRNAKYQIADTLNTTGIYSTVRHPLYLGNFFMWLGPVLLTGHVWFIIVFCLGYWLYYERIMYSEEQFLRRKFGDVYTSWAEKVPAFVPSFKFRPSCPSLQLEKNSEKGEKRLCRHFHHFLPDGYFRGTDQGGIRL